MSMAGAGIVQGLIDNLQFSGKALKDIGLNDGMGAYFGKQFIEHAGRASANALLLGTPLDKALEGAPASSLLSTGTAFGADAIGQWDNRYEFPSQLPDPGWSLRELAAELQRLKLDVDARPPGVAQVNYERQTPTTR
ncbi:MAG: hypothetical protein GTO38_12205 [Hydrogenophaga sp.]|nr:hypothetical protein [Hydrogenophaga sp.]NIN56180.1 hypothetical protein [Hydrogenophaga sp.]NIO52402.1 hypothetical protein [Hydrogenophaga sp.]